MFITLVNVIIWLVILGLAYWLIGLIPMPTPFPTLIRIAFILLAIVVILSLFGVFNVGVPRLWK
jgi:hypothetical protein